VKKVRIALCTFEIANVFTEALMSENEIVHKRCPLNPSLPPPLLSSIELGWKGLVVERYSVSPCELPDDQHPNADNMANG
jgi:hypothetical protein